MHKYTQAPGTMLAVRATISGGGKHKKMKKIKVNMWHTKQWSQQCRGRVG